MTLSIEHLNSLPDSGFVSYLGDVAEHSPWVMQRVAKHRPFSSIRGLVQAVSVVISDASDREQLSLICAHPDLAGKAARAGAMTQASVNEQSGAGLDRLTDDEFERFEHLNTSYQSKYGFPFIIAVKGHDKTSILRAFEVRLQNDSVTERREALDQIGEIIRLRLENLIDHNS